MSQPHEVAGEPAATVSLRSELGAMRRLATPLALAQMLVMLMGVVDTAVVSRFDATHAAGATLGGSLAFGLLVFGMGLAVALEPLMAQARGAGDPARAWGWWRTGVRVTLIVAVPLSAVALVLCALADSVGISEEIRDHGLAYLAARTPANLLMLLWMAARSFLQSHQLSRPLLVSAVVANVFNLAADIALVDGLVTWGATGAGVATSISTTVLVLMLVRGVRDRRPPAGTDVPRGDARLLLRLGLPLGLQLAAEFLVFSTCGILATSLGAIEGNAHQVALHCTTLTFMAAVGISGATAARVGEAVGMRRPDLMRLRARAGFILTMALMVTTALAFALIPGPIIGLFSPASDEVRAMSIELLAIAALFQLFDGTQVLVSGALRGAGDVRFPFVLTTIAYWGVGFPTAVGLCFSAGLGLKGLWYGLTAGLFAASVGLVWRYLAIERRGVGELEPSRSEHS